jgi:hypothetical protein
MASIFKPSTPKQPQIPNIAAVDTAAAEQGVEEARKRAAAALGRASTMLSTRGGRVDLLGQ